MHLIIYFLLLLLLLCGQDVQWLQTITKLPILVKGVLTAEDGIVKLLFFRCSDGFVMLE